MNRLSGVAIHMLTYLALADDHLKLGLQQSQCLPDDLEWFNGVLEKVS
jgi:hypothetical protein